MHLIVEDGTGIPNADSYNSIAELDAYMVKFGYADWPQSQMPENTPISPSAGRSGENVDDGVDNGGNEPTEPDNGDSGEMPNIPSTPITPAEPIDANLEKKQAAARRAALYIDSTYGTRFTGDVVNPDQGLLWPRKGAVDFFGRDIPSDRIPKEIKQAHAEITLLAYKNTQLALQTDSGPLLVRKKIDTLEWEWDSDTYGNKPIFGWVDSLLTPLLGPAEEVGAMDILGIQRA